MHYSHGRLIAIGALVISANVTAQEFKEQLTLRLADVLVQIEATTGNKGSIFSKRIENQVSKLELSKIFTDFYANLGKCALLARSQGSAPTSESFILKCQRGYAVVDLSIEDRTPFLIDGFWIRRIFSEAHPGSAGNLEVIPGLFYPAEVAELAAKRKCNLPSGAQMIDWAVSKMFQLPEGFYWLAHKENEIGFVEYFHLPSVQIVEYGNNIFQAKLLLICPKASKSY